MKSKIFCVSAALAVSLLSACATTATTADNRDAKEEQVYVTGSNLPRKDRSSVTTVSAEALRDLQPGVATNASGR